MERKTNYGKIIAITLSIVTASCAIAFVLYRLIRNLISFCTVYEEPAELEDYPEFDEALEYEEEMTDAPTRRHLPKTPQPSRPDLGRSEKLPPLRRLFRFTFYCNLFYGSVKGQFSLAAKGDV